MRAFVDLRVCYLLSRLISPKLMLSLRMLPSSCACSHASPLSCTFFLIHIYLLACSSPASFLAPTIRNFLSLTCCCCYAAPLCGVWFKFGWLKLCCCGTSTTCYGGALRPKEETEGGNTGGSIVDIVPEKDD